MKKNNFQNLSWLLDKQQITEDDFQAELDTNPDHYAIDLTGDVNEDIINIVNEILGELDIQLNVDEVGELFSLDPRKLDEFIKQFQVDTEENADN